MSIKIDCCLIDDETKGDILENNALKEYFEDEHFLENQTLRNLLDESMNGSTIFRCGKGEKNIMLIGGVHGDELPPQAALTRLIYEIVNDEWSFNCKLHIMPFSIPEATMFNSRYYQSKDMNRNANIEGITKTIIDYASSNNVKGLCDCHSTDPRRKPGIKSVFCSLKPTLESFQIAKYIKTQTNSYMLPVKVAGSALSGAVEDESNLRGIPSVTCESVSPVGSLRRTAIVDSYNQIMSFLNYFGHMSRKN